MERRGDVIHYIKTGFYVQERETTGMNRSIYVLHTLARRLHRYINRDVQTLRQDRDEQTTHTEKDPDKRTLRAQSYYSSLISLKFII